ncbi:MAG: ABC transporter ATP-binding protein [Planctomycetia bacterium]|nr:ABC transporter ATP-binding protein [Planctomycetia bacterium]
MTSSPAIDVVRVSHHYGQRQALCDLDLAVREGEIFAVVGPNGGGKTTLFRLLSTLLPPQSGQVRILGHDVVTETFAVRALIGIVFQAPGLDRQLTVAENLRHQGHLYGMSGLRLKQRQDDLLTRLRLSDRRDERVATLSGGLRRRVELAKGMLHGPRLLLLDEPSTGLDPAARRDLWDYLTTLRREDGVTVVLTTHLLEEAELADRIALLDAGKLLALDTPDALRATVGGDAITIRAREPAALAVEVRARFGCAAEVVDDSVRLEQPDGHQWIARLVEAFPGRIDAVTFSRPTLEDVFIDRTGHRFAHETAEQRDAAGGKRRGKGYA